MTRTTPALLLLTAWVLSGPAAHATWSIVAVDEKTREVGVAIASCIGGSEVAAKLVPGVGAIVAQAMSNFEGRDRLAELLAEGTSPTEALAQVAHPDFDSGRLIPTLRLRQYGVVALGHEDAPAQFTGDWTSDWAGARAGRGVAVQGNLLARATVVERALEAFQADPKTCEPTLADRLIAALEAGLNAGGDRRCSEELGALSALLAVATPDDPPAAPGLSVLRTHAAAGPRGFSWIFREIRRNWLEPEQGLRSESPVVLVRQAYARGLAASGGKICAAAR